MAGGVCIAVDVIKLMAALWLSGSASLASTLLALAVLLLINAHRLAAVLVDKFEQTPEEVANGPHIVSLHKCILAALTTLLVVDVLVADALADRLDDCSPPFELFCAIVAVMQLARLWRTVARYSVETFDRYSSATGLAQSRKHTLVTAIDVCFHAFQLINSAAFALLVTMYCRSQHYVLRHNHGMLACVAALLGVQMACAVIGAGQLMLQLQRRARHIDALVDRVPPASSDSKDLCAICRDDDDDNDKERRCDARIRLDCAHVFHRDCLALWLSCSLHCPLCRASCVSAAALDKADISRAPLFTLAILYT